MGTLPHVPASLGNEKIKLAQRVSFEIESKFTLRSAPRHQQPLHKQGCGEDYKKNKKIKSRGRGRVERHTQKAYQKRSVG